VKRKAKRRGDGKLVGVMIAAFVGACAFSAPATDASKAGEPATDTGTTEASGEAGAGDLPPSEGDSAGASGSTSSPPPVDDPVPPPVTDPPPVDEPTPPGVGDGTTQPPGAGETTPGSTDPPPPPPVDPPVGTPPVSGPPPTDPATPGGDLVPDAPTSGNFNAVPIVVASEAPDEAAPTVPAPTVPTLSLGQSGGDRIDDAPSSRYPGRESENGRTGEATAPKGFTLGASSVGASSGAASAAGGAGGGASTAIGLAFILCFGLQCLGRLLRLPPEAARSLTLVLSLERPG
jgi:hypothetical protein